MLYHQDGSHLPPPPISGSAHPRRMRILMREWPFHLSGPAATEAVLVDVQRRSTWWPQAHAPILEESRTIWRFRPPWIPAAVATPTKLIRFPLQLQFQRSAPLQAIRISHRIGVTINAWAKAGASVIPISQALPTSTRAIATTGPVADNNVVIQWRLTNWQTKGRSAL